jgi:hypothetical protein
MVTITELKNNIIKNIKMLNDELEFFSNYKKQIKEYTKSCILKDPENKKKYKLEKKNILSNEKKRLNSLYRKCNELIKEYSFIMTSKKTFISLIEKCDFDNIKFIFNFNNKIYDELESMYYTDIKIKCKI